MTKKKGKSEIDALWEVFKKTSQNDKRMTPEEFQQQSEEKLSILPPEFRSAVSCQAWREGHSAGYEEVLLYLDMFIDMLIEPIKAYNKRHGI